MQVEDRVDQRLAAVGDREAVAQPRADGLRADVAGGAIAVRLAGLDDLVLRAMLLVSAELAAVVQAGGLATFPLDLVDGQGPAAGAAGRREQLGDREPEARLAVRRRRERRERRVEVAQVGRPEDQLGEEAGERAALEAECAALPIDRRPGDPAAAPVQVGDDVARLRARLEARLEQVRRGRRREPFECRQREPRLRPGEEQPAKPRHRARLWQVDSAARLAG